MAFASLLGQRFVVGIGTSAKVSIEATKSSTVQPVAQATEELALLRRGPVHYGCSPPWTCHSDALPHALAGCLAKTSYTCIKLPTISSFTSRVHLAAIKVGGGDGHLSLWSVSLSQTSMPVVHDLEDPRLACVHNNER